MRRANILSACVGVRTPIPFSISNLLYFLYVRACHMVNQSEVNEMFFENTIDMDAPGLESYDGRCINVN